MVEPVSASPFFGSVVGWVGGWTGAKTGWASFQKAEHNFLVGRVEMWTSAKTGWAELKTGWAGFQKIEHNLREGWVENSMSFFKSIHDKKIKVFLEDFEEN